MGRLGILLTCFLSLMAAVTNVAVGQEDLSSTYEKSNNAVALITSQDGARDGSGVIIGITESGSVLILTARHVVDGHDDVDVFFAGDLGRTRAGTVQESFYVETEDMAIVLVQNPPSHVEVIRFRESAGKKGESVGTIGNPLGEAFTWSNGNITNIHGKHLIHDARLQRGSSGGPLLDHCGRMLGMNVRVLVDDGDAPQVGEELLSGAGVALSTNSIVAVLDGWFSDTRFREKWKFKKYCSFWERLYKQPVVLVVEAALIAGGVYAFVSGGGEDPTPTEDPEFGNPPGPPDG